METFFLKLAVAVIPLIALVASVIMISSISSWHKRHTLALHRRRRSILRIAATSAMPEH